MGEMFGFGGVISVSSSRWVFADNWTIWQAFKV
jgi:hypothetical protein